MRPVWALAVALAGPLAADDPTAIQKCLSCHMVGAQLDITGVAALRHLPPFWPMLFEDAQDRDGDGIAGRARFVSGSGSPILGKWGKNLAAARFEDFAQIAGDAHDIDVSGDLDAIYNAFVALSPSPPEPFETEADAHLFTEKGCAACHVTQSYDFEQRQVTPLSDFLLHDLGDGETRTAPLWRCSGECLDYTH